MTALSIAAAAIAQREGCCLRSYPDPASPLSRALSRRNLLNKYKRGQASIPADLHELPGAPWTIGYGETLGVVEDVWWTQAQAEAVLTLRVASFATGVLKRCPQLHLESDNRLAACISLAYNIGLGAFGASSVCTHTRRREYAAAANSFLLWNKAAGKIMAGLSARRQWERLLYLQG